MDGPKKEKAPQPLIVRAAPNVTNTLNKICRKNNISRNRAINAIMKALAEEDYLGNLIDISEAAKGNAILRRDIGGDTIEATLIKALDIGIKALYKKQIEGEAAAEADNRPLSQIRAEAYKEKIRGQAKQPKRKEPEQRPAELPQIEQEAESVSDEELEKMLEEMEANLSRPKTEAKEPEQRPAELPQIEKKGTGIDWDNISDEEPF